MAAIVTGLTRDGREGSAVRADISLRTEIVLVDTYWIETTDGTDNSDVALQAAGLPLFGDLHPRVANLNVTGKAALEVTGRTDRWTVKVTYESQPIDDDDVDIDFEIHRVPVAGGNAKFTGEGSMADGVLPFAFEADWGTPIINSAGEPFVPVVEDDEAFMVVRISRSEFVNNLDDIKKYTNSLNEKEFLGGKPHTWIMMVRARPVTNSFIKLWRIEYLCKYNKLTWNLRLLDQGRYYRETPGKPPAGVRIPFLDDQGDNIVKPLNGKGGALADGVAPVFLRLNRKEVADWTPLDLEGTIEKFYSGFENIAPPPEQLFPGGIA